MATLLSTIVFGQVRATNASHIHKCLGTLLSYKWKTLRLIVNINIKTERTICQSECIKNIYFCYLQKKKIVIITMAAAAAKNIIWKRNKNINKVTTTILKQEGLHCIPRLFVSHLEQTSVSTIHTLGWLCTFLPSFV